MSIHTRPVPCPRCQKLTHAATVRTNIWQGDKLIVVEGIPAQMCEICQEQYYDPMVSETLRALMDDLGLATPVRVIEVPVYSLEGKIPDIPEAPEGEERQWEVEGEY